MTFARRFEIISLMSVGLLLVVLGLLMWSSGELKSAERDDELADDIQVIIFERATLRDEYYLHGVERARQQWLALNKETEQLLGRAKEQFSREEDQKILKTALNDFDQSVQIWQRLVEQTQRIMGSKGHMHSNEFAGHLYSQIMLKDSALQQASALLQHTTRDRYNSAQDRMIVLTFLLVLLIGMGTLLASNFMSGMLRSRFAALSHGTEIIASGDFSYRIPGNGTDELAELGEAFNNVTQKVQEYTQALHESEERARLQLQELANIYTHTPVGLLAVDRDLRFLRLNERLAEIDGKSIEEHLGRSIDETLPPGLAATLKEIWQPVLERGECVLDAEMQWTVSGASDLQQHWLASYQPILSHSGAVEGLTGFMLEITERKRAEQVMAGAREQLELEVMQRTANLSLANLHLLQEIEVRKKVEVELLAQQQKLQEMALDVSMAEERERDRIASELHDQVGQRLILAKIRIDTLASRLPHGEYEAEAAGVETLIEQTIQDIRSLTFQIRPPLLASAGLEAALRWLGEELQADFGLEVTFSDDGREKPLRYEVRSTVFQAARELMLNVAKHAGTKKCRVDFSRLDDSLIVQVEDDGVGVKPGAGDGSSARSGGFGLQNVRQKIGHLGGALAIEARTEGGTRAVIRVPLEKTLI